MADEHHDDGVVDSYSDVRVLDFGEEHIDIDLFVDETKSPPSLQDLSHATATNPQSSEQPQASSGIICKQMHNAI